MMKLAGDGPILALLTEWHAGNFGEKTTDSSSDNLILDVILARQAFYFATLEALLHSQLLPWGLTCWRE